MLNPPHPRTKIDVKNGKTEDENEMDWIQCFNGFGPRKRKGLSKAHFYSVLILINREKKRENCYLMMIDSTLGEKYFSAKIKKCFKR